MPWDRYNIHNVQILNLDVLDVIFAFLHNYRDTWSMMQTCRSHYRLGISHLLASSPHPITISNARSIASFRRFMLAGPFSSEKFRAFRSLTIKPSFSEDNGDHLHVASDLVRILNRSTHLEQLVIWDVTRFFGLWPEIQQAAVNSLPRLNLLRLSKVDDRSIDLLKGMISPLRTLTLARPDLQFYAANILPALSNISATLTDLTLTCELRLPEEQVVFHQMRVLRIHDCHLPPTSHVIPTFPNLTELILEEFGGVSGVLDLQAIRLDNQKRIHALASRWTSLSLLKGDMECIYSLGLSCQIDSLEIDTWISKEDLPILLEIFDNSRPRKLNMALSCEELTMVSFRHPFFQRMFDLLSSTCHSLELEIFFDFLLSDISELVVQSLQHSIFRHALMVV